MINNLKCYDFGGNGGSSDQKFFNHYIGNHMNDFNCVILERNFYPNGNYFYENYELINDYCFIIHFNCLKGEYKKIKKIIEFDKLVVKLIDYLPNDENTLAEKDITEYKNLLDSINIYDNIEVNSNDINLNPDINHDNSEFLNKDETTNLINEFEINDNIEFNMNNEENIDEFQINITCSNNDEDKVVLEKKDINEDINEEINEDISEEITEN